MANPPAETPFSLRRHVDLKAGPFETLAWPCADHPSAYQARWTCATTKTTEATMVARYIDEEGAHTAAAAHFRLYLIFGDNT